MNKIRVGDCFKFLYDSNNDSDIWEVRACRSGCFWYKSSKFPERNDLFESNKWIHKWIKEGKLVLLKESKIKKLLDAIDKV